MANHSSRRGSGGAGKRFRAVTAMTEPEVRRWPHPVDGVSPSDRRTGAGEYSGDFSGWPLAPGSRTDPALYYIHCALSYQNQLLADIKALLERLSPDSAPAREE